MSLPKKPERIAKAIAASGFCSRRDAEKLILEGRVKLNGEVLKTPAVTVTDEAITIDDKPLKAKEAARLFKYYKPIGLVTTHKDELGRDTVFDHLPEELPRVVSVGRLDLNSEGLLLLTTDGELARSFELPSSGLERVYRVRVFGRVPINELRDLRLGITIEGVEYAPIYVKIEKLDTNSWIEVTLTEGKNREIRKVMKHFGLEVNRLIRVQYGEYKLGEMKPGDVWEI
jgi:23S rRNA pseudouridine2605 synthase